MRRRELVELLKVIGLILGLIAAGIAGISLILGLLITIMVGFVLLISIPLAGSLWVLLTVFGVGAMLGLPQSLQAPTLWETLLFCATWGIVLMSFGSLTGLRRRTPLADLAGRAVKAVKNA